MTYSSKVKFDFSLFERNLKGSLIKVVKEAVDESLRIVANDAKALTYQKIADNIEISKAVAKNSYTVSGEVFVDLTKVPYARAVEKGSGMHEPNNPHKISIDATDKPALVFWWEAMEVLFKGQHVDHPGVKAVPYLSKSLQKNTKRIYNIIKARIGA